MIMLESMLLWVVAGVSVILILQYVMKTSATPERPQGGLGKRFPVGPRRIKSAFGPSEVSSLPRRRRVEASIAPVEAADEQQVVPMRTRELSTQQAAYVEPSVIPEVEPVIVEAVAPEQPVQPIRKRRTDTMQLMLNKAISERR